MKKIFVIFMLLLPVCLFGQNGLVYTIAGGGTSTAEWVPATSTLLSTSDIRSGVVLDAEGNIYTVVASNTVKKIEAATGLIHTVAGNGASGFSGDGGPATNATISSISGIGIDRFNNLYITDFDNGRIRKVDAGTGIITTVAGQGASGGPVGDGGPATSAFIGTSLCGVVFDASGNMLLEDNQHGTIRKVDMTTNIITTIAGGGSITLDGTLATLADIGDPKSSIALDQVGNLYMYDYARGKVNKIDAANHLFTTVAGGGTGFVEGAAATSVALAGWSRLAIDPMGNLIIAAQKIYKVNVSTGKITTIGGGGADMSNGIPSINAHMYTKTVATDPLGNIYYYDMSSSLLRKITSTYTGFAADSFNVNINSDCIHSNFIVSTGYFHSGISVKTYFGDGTSATNVLTGLTTSGEANFSHAYATSGTYSITNVLYNGSTAIDSLTYPYHFSFCNELAARFYFDVDNNCSFDSIIDHRIFQPLLTEIAINNIPKDTISSTSGFNYKAYGTPGDVITLRIISSPPGLGASCPATGIIYDTLQAGTLVQPRDLFGMNCTSTPGFDLQQFCTLKAFGNSATADILVDNTYCNLQDGIVTMNISPKYNFVSSSQTPASVSGHTITWNVASLFADEAQRYIHVSFHRSAPTPYLPGDTVISNYNIDPTTGDAIPSSNYSVRIDTVKSGFDPNYITVTPEGYIPSSTLLQYGIGFENTGNDTAHNITVLDTLSEHLNIHSLRMLAASATMNISMEPYGEKTIVKFDFPNINLQDSSHHDQCNGMLMYSIKVKDNLLSGTVIPNRAGIYFDTNPVVMTNTAINIIGWPLGISTLTKENPIELYPNPATNQLTINTLQGNYTSLTITSSVGNTVMQHPITNTTTTLDVQFLPAGIYYVTVRGVAGIKAGRFVKL